MNTDIRIAINVLQHPKIIKLQKRLGADAVICLIRLWCWVACNRATGHLLNLESEDIELAAQWEGEQGQLTETLLELHLLDDGDNGYQIHNWAQHNPWAAQADERSSHARKAAQARWAQRKGSQGDAPGINEQCPCTDEHESGNAPSLAFPSPSSPSPNSSLSVEAQDVRAPRRSTPPEGQKPREDQAIRRGKAKSSSADALFDEFWGVYPRKVGKQAARKVWLKLAVEDMRQAVHSIQKQIKAQHFRGNDGRDFIPNPATWLTQGRWEDDLTPAQTRASPKKYSDATLRTMRNAEDFIKRGEDHAGQ